MVEIKSLGIDVGSTTAKIVGIDSSGKIVWYHLEQAHPRVEEQADRFIQLAYQQAGDPCSIPIVATGYGRGLVNLAKNSVTEITCHARGIYSEMHHGGTLVDIGGQDSKVIRIDPSGKVVDFMMNDKCAAGTGRFLENTATRLGVRMENMGDQALSVSEEVSISSTCTVFAESEVISLISHGVLIPPILRGLHRSLIKRIMAMIRTLVLVPPLMLSGGVAKNPAIRQMLEEESGEKIILPIYPQLIGAYGAALSALET
jgi:predicted CoA-substrate-specific enzyme activase